MKSRAWTTGLGTVIVSLLVLSGACLSAEGQFAEIHSFTGGTNDGVWPMGAVVANGSSLYGMAQLGGVSNFGVVYTMNAEGVVYTNLFSFQGFNGRYPVGKLLLSGGNLYGMTVRGGASDNGVIFRLSTNGTGYTVLYEFSTNANCGATPLGGLLMNGSSFYGMTYYGGVSNLGTIFRINTDGSGYTNLHEFVGYGGDGKHPKGDLVSDGGKLYGMTSQGGSNDAGVIFSMAMNGYAYGDLYEFTGQTNSGAFPEGSLIKVGNNLYGTAHGGASGGGIVFSIPANGGTLNILKNLGDVVDSGREPFGTLINHAPNIYGITRYGGTNNAGVLFTLGGGTTYSNLYEWPAGAGEPVAEGTFMGDVLYGTTLRGGGPANKGTAYKLDMSTTNVVAVCAITWVENGQLGTVNAGDLSTDRIWVDENTAPGFPDQAYAGYGKTQNADDGTWTWVPMTDYGIMGTNYEFTGTLGRASSGNYYVAAKFVKAGHTYYANDIGVWGDWNTPLLATNRWTVRPLATPASAYARFDSTNTIEVHFNGDGIHWSSIFRKSGASASFIPPVDGTTYTVGADYPDQGMCVYRGGDNVFVDMNLPANSVFCYQLCTENFGYYSTAAVVSASTDPNRDDDGDGMPNGWEVAYGFNPGIAADGMQDADGDGMLNWKEYVAGTDPTSSSSVFQILNRFYTNSQFVLSWSSVSGKYYFIYRTTNLSAGFTTLLATNLPANPPANTFTDTVPGGALYYYDIRVQ